MTASSAIAAVAGRGIVVPGPDVDTDRIMPARFLKAITFEGLEAHLFADDRVEASRQGRVHPFDDPVRRGARVLVAGVNFGCGSSREHAPQALQRWGIGAIVGPSFADIFFANALSIGLPCVSVSKADAEALGSLVTRSPELEIVVDLENGRVSCAGVSFEVTMPAAARHALVTGAWDVAAELAGGEAAVRQVASRLPYLRRFEA